MPEAASDHTARPAAAQRPAPAAASVGAGGELARFFALSLDLFCVATREGSLRRVNPAFERALGYTEAELLAGAFLDLVHPDDRVATGAELDKLALGLPSSTFENRIRRRDGSYRWLGWTTAPDPESGLLYAVGRDITDRKRAESHVRLLQQLTQAIGEADDLAEALRAALRGLCAAEGWAYGEAWLPGPDDTLVCSPVFHADAPALHAFRAASERRTCPPERTLPGRVWRGQRPEWRADVTAEPDAGFCRVEEARAVGLRACVGVPILADGEVLAVLVLLDRSARPEDPAALELLSAVTTQLGSLVRRKRAEEALRRSEERFRLAGRATNDVLYDWEMAGDTVWLSEALADLGYSERTVGITWWMERLHPRDRARVSEGLAAAMARGDRLWSDEYAFRRADGSYAEVFDRGCIVYDERGAVVRIIGVMMDVTARRQAERELARSEARLREAQAIAGIGSWEWDGRRGTVEWSAELYRMHGLPPDAPITDTTALALVHPEDRRGILERYRRAVRAGEGASFEYRVVRPDGEIRVLRGSISPELDEAGRPVRVLGTTQDVTEQRRAEQERKQLEARVAIGDRLASLGTLAAGVAHEINNPLAYVLGNADFARRGFADLRQVVERVERLTIEWLGAEGARMWEEVAPAGLARALADLAEALGDVSQGAERIRTIVRDMRLFARAGDADERALVHVRPALESSINIARAEIKHRARLVKDYGEVPPVEANEARLGQVFLNLLVNAAQAIPEGRASEHEIRVVTRTDAAGRVVVEVSDTGHGIAPEHLPRVFDPFFSTKQSGGGMGLGLAICHNIVRALGGEIQVESRLGHGTTFRVVLPPARVGALPAPAASPAPRPERRARILVVDDEVMVVAALTRILGAEHEVIAAHSGREALARIAADRGFDLILTDLLMPEMTGMELHAEVARAAPELAERMVFLSGGAYGASARAFLDRVPNPRFEKPLDARGLRAMIEERLRRG